MKKVIIIGAGPAGLTAGYELLKANNSDYEVLILELDKQVGGISKTVNYKGNRIDIGGHRFFTKNNDVERIWLELMPIQGELAYDDKKIGIDKKINIGGPNPETENNTMLIRRRISRIFYLKKFFDYPIKLSINTFKNMGIIKTFKASLSYIKSSIIKKKEDSLENFYINRFGKVLYSMFFEKYTEKVWGRKPKEISSDWGKQRVKGISIIEILKSAFMNKCGLKNKNIETSLIEEFWYPKYGSGQLYEIMASKIEKMGGKIELNTKVTNFTIKDSRISGVKTICEGVEKYINGDIFISTVALKELVCNIEGINVSQEIIKIAEGLPYRDFITVGVLLKKLNLENKTKLKTLNNIIPDCWIYIQEPEVKMGRIQVFNNWSPYLVNNVDENIWIGLEYFCNENDELWNMKDESFSDFAIKEMEKIGIAKKDDVLDLHIERIKKAYPAYFDTYKEIEKLRCFLDNFKNLYCIGRNGQHRYNNMDHSMLTAIEAVNNIKNNIDTKENVWNVNTEAKYHEAKNN